MRVERTPALRAIEDEEGGHRIIDADGVTVGRVLWYKRLRAAYHIEYFTAGVIVNEIHDMAVIDDQGIVSLGRDDLEAR